VTPSRLPVIGIVCCAGTIAALAQTPAPPAQVPPVFRSDTRLVEVSVVVHDKSGAPAVGLTRGDFTLYDEGKEQRIELFSVDSDQTVGTAPVLAPGEYSNRTEGRTSGAVTVVLFDRVNTSLADQRQARDQVVKVLGQIRREDRVALYVLDSTSLRMLHDFTSDSTSLIRVFSKQPAREAPEIDALDVGDRPLACPMCDEAGGLSGFLLGAAQDLSNLVTKTRIEMSAAALETIAHRLAGVQGRKNLIWVSSGFPLVLSGHLGVEQMTEPVDRATRAASDANVAIYPVDARGLVVNQMPSVMTSNATFGNTGDLPPRPPSRTVSFDSAKMLAADTGGRAFFNTNDIASAVRGALDDGRLTYVLGYYPSHGKWNGAFRAITVQVNRPGVDVRHRLGYAALPLPSVKTAAQTRTDALLEQAGSPLEATGIGLTGRVTRDGAETSRDVTIAIHVDPGAISIWRDGDNWSVSLALAIAQSTPDGQVVKSVVGDVDVGVPAARYEQIMTKGFNFTRNVALVPTATRVQVVLRDPATGATGSLIIPVSAPASPR
jgi:VWFA-related protein